MTGDGGDISGVDFDLLADYAGGALRDTADEALVAARIATDPAWRDAYRELTTALTAVAGQLRTVAEEPVTMPDDVATRLTAAFAAADPPPRLAAVDAHRAARHVDEAPALPGDAPATFPRGRSRRRWLRWAAPVAVAAGVVAFAGLGAGQLLDRSGDAADTTAGSAADVTVERAPDESAQAGPGFADRIRVSGTDYDDGTLSGTLRFVDPDAPTGAEQSDASVLSFPRVAPVLARLQEPAALAACVDAVDGAHGAGPVTVELIDFARFRGAPVLVLLFTDRAGDRWAWVSGPACGAAGAGPDTVYRAQVG